MTEATQPVKPVELQSNLPSEIARPWPVVLLAALTGITGVIPIVFGTFFLLHGPERDGSFGDLFIPVFQFFAVMLMLLGVGFVLNSVSLWLGSYRAWVLSAVIGVSTGLTAVSAGDIWSGLLAIVILLLVFAPDTRSYFIHKRSERSNQSDVANYSE